MSRLTLILLVVLALPGTALAAAPANDNRDAAEVIDSFPETLPGTTVEATVERLDPQLSRCGSVEGTVWYRIDQAPDGRIALDVQAAGLAPVVRVYRRQTSSITELDCSTAGAGGRASVSFGAVRGAGYLVLVGRRPGTADAAFELNVKLFLPPANDGRVGARTLSLPGRVGGTTLGATADDSDPGACELDAATVWYRLRSPAGRRVVLTLSAGGALDATFVLIEQRRSQLRPLGCGATGDRGVGRGTYVPRVGSRYYLVIGHQGASDPGAFTLSGVVAQAAERQARPLPAGGIRTSVHYLTDVNDLWRVTLRAGVTYKVGLQAGETCPTAVLRRGNRVLFTIGCGGVRTFTPGPDGGGAYRIEVVAGEVDGMQPYRLRVVTAGADDLGVGTVLPNATTVRASLSRAALDVVDLWHFDIERTSDVSLDLRGAGLLTLLQDAGSRLGSGDRIRRQLGPGRYVVAVSGDDGAYRLTLLVREITRTTLLLSETTVSPGRAVSLRPQVTPTSGGVVEIQIDRFDPLTGWHFHRLVRVAADSSLSWTPPAEGRWRARARFLGTGTASPSLSGYVQLLVERRV